MGWEQELDKILHDLQVVQEHTGEPAERVEQPVENDTQCPDMTCIRSSQRRYGVWYRMDLTNDEPQLRVTLPVNTGPVKQEVYAVYLNHKQLHALCVSLLHVQGSSEAFRESKVVLDYHLLLGCCEVMKELFWQGDRRTMTFPAEIFVERLL